MSDIKTLTVDELIAQLTKYPSDTKVFMSRDGEGNGYNTISATSFEANPLDKAVAIYPDQEHVEWDEAFPNTWEAEDES